MTLLRIAFIALLLPLTLAACQTSHTASSTYAGTSLRSDPASVIRSNHTKKRKFKKKAASLVVKRKAATRKTAAKKASKKVAKRSIVRKKRSIVKKKRKRSLKRSIAHNKKVKRKSKRKITLFKKKSKKRKHTRVAKSNRKAGSKSRYRNIIARHARQNGVPLKLAMAVVQVESNYKASARGQVGEVGLMQIRPRTARGIGYKGSIKNLYNPETNIRYGMKYLGKAYKLGGRSTCGAILKYNAGHGAKRMNPISRKYCSKVRRIMGRS